jgi:hypothetical protein
VIIHVVECGFGDASGKGFGSTITLNGVILWQAGQWEPSYEEESSNLRELENIVRALEEYYVLLPGNPEVQSRSDVIHKSLAKLIAHWNHS